MLKKWVFIYFRGTILKNFSNRLWRLGFFGGRTKFLTGGGVNRGPGLGWVGFLSEPGGGGTHRFSQGGEHVWVQVHHSRAKVEERLLFPRLIFIATRSGSRVSAKVRTLSEVFSPPTLEGSLATAALGFSGNGRLRRWRASRETHS